MRKILALILMLCCIPLAQGIKPSTLYQADLFVNSQSPEIRTAAERQGLIQVLIKLTTDSAIVNNPMIQTGLKKADYYVQEFSYSLPTPTSSHYQLNIQFNKADLNKLLKKAGIAIWEEDRPLLLVWLTLTKDEQTDIIGNDDHGSVLNTLKEEAKKYGLPLIFPVMDVNELNHIRPQQVLSLDLENLRKVSHRYQADGYLIANIVRNGDSYASKWYLIYNKDQWQWSMVSTSIEKILQNGVQEITHSLAKKHLVKTPEIQDIWIKLEVSNINERDELSMLLDYLKNTNSVQRVQLSQVEGTVVRVAVLVHGNLGTFIQQASLGKRLILRSQYEDANILLYEWIH